MYIIKNALGNVLRNKGRNSILIVIMFLIILSASIMIIINQSTSAIINDYKNKFGSEASITMDSEKIMKMDKNADIKSLNYEDFKKYVDSKYVKNAELTGVNGILTNKKALDEDKENDGGMVAVTEGADGKQESVKPPTGKLIGTDLKGITKEFETGERKIIKGKKFEKDNEILISSEYAKLNNLDVGSKIKIKGVALNKYETYTVSGIYLDSTKKSSLPMEIAYDNRRNEFITSLKTLAKTEMFKKEGEVESAIYLKSPNDLKAFEKEVRDKGLPDYYKVLTDTTSYNKIVAPVEGLANITKVIMIIVLGVGALILIMLTSLMVRERKYEVGVLRAMGMKKGKVILSFMLEMFIITGISLVLALGIGKVASQPIADTMFSQQLKTVEKKEKETQTEGTIVYETPKEVETLKNVKVDLDAKAIGEIFLAALLIAVVASGVSIMYISRFEPMKILSERN